MKKLFDVYLGGAMGGRPVGLVLSERQEAKHYCHEFGLSFYCPASDEGLEKMDPGLPIATNYNLAKMENFVSKDDKHVDQSRYFVNLTGDSKSDGTGWEMGRAYYQNKTPIILVAPLRATGKLMQFSNLKAFYIARTIREALYQVKLLKEITRCPTSSRTKKRH